MKQQLIAQIWHRNSTGNETALNNKFYSKVGTAKMLANKYNNCTFKLGFYFVKVFEIKEVQYD